MTNQKRKDHTGYSEASLTDAISDALAKADEHSHYEVIETRSSRFADEKRRYQVTLTTFVE